MSTTTRPTTNHPSTSSTTPPPPTERSYFEQQREILLKEIGTSFEHVLANMNKLNRNLEAVITVGNEFAGVEALWSQFENVMGDASHGRDGGDGGKDGKDGEGDTVDGSTVEESVEESTMVMDVGIGRRR